MPRGGVFISPQERQRIRQSYYAASEKEAGVAHLWHLQQLAEIRFNPSHTIQDAPDVDFQSPYSPMDDYRELFAQRYAQQVQHDEARVRELNRITLRNIALASDDAARRARHMNLVPTEDQVKYFDNSQQQALHRTLDRARRQRAMAEENKKLLDHLICVPPHVRTAKELDAWYRNVHKKHLAHLSKFKAAEHYAGARLLEGTASYAAASRAQSRARGSAKKRPDYGAALPLVRGQPFPPPSIAECARTAPSSLKPAGAATTFNGLPLSWAGDTAESSRHPRRPEWQPISATDIPLLHYGADLQLRGCSGGSSATGREVGGSSPRRNSSPLRLPLSTQRELFPSVQSSSLGKAQGVRLIAAQEEGGVTQLWRRAVKSRHGGGSSGRGKSTHSLPAYEADGGKWGSGGEVGIEARTSTPLPAPHSPFLRSMQPQERRQRVSSTEPDAGGEQQPQKQQQQRQQQQQQQQQRLSKKASPLSSSSRPPLAVVRAATATAPDERNGSARRGNALPADEDGEVAALKGCIEGWDWHVEASNTVYAPI
ncbi:hypothetical protein ABL78_7718 [Leptomonas seymouri]|uniref:Uncharacterized protein n=1 Tax=Leptomonas seymouri TaxID=5684 RepID=A0A0N1I063_LEPSE|nr:hypothetical protein ABL78_7718 [Leptomonas seymouri]|eukprot:KPI83260.1 hypothetical protein ABL78_7718 [Leptomonas seymouri]